MTNLVTIGIIMLMVWCMYITIVIYNNEQVEGMDKTERCTERFIAGTKTCNNVYTHYGLKP